MTTIVVVAENSFCFFPLSSKFKVEIGLMFSKGSCGIFEEDGVVVDVFVNFPLFDALFVVVVVVVVVGEIFLEDDFFLNEPETDALFIANVVEEEATSINCCCCDSFERECLREEPREEVALLLLLLLLLLKAVDVDVDDIPASLSEAVVVRSPRLLLLLIAEPFDELRPEYAADDVMDSWV